HRRATRARLTLSLHDALPISRVRAAFLAGERYEDGHPHVHGANLGVSAAAYRAVGGFPPLAAHEDQALVAALARDGFVLARRPQDRKSTRLNSSHVKISYAVF